MSRLILVAITVCIGLVSLAALVMSSILISNDHAYQSSTCWTKQQRTLSRLANVLATKDTSQLPLVFTEDAVFDTVESGGFLLNGLDNITAGIEFLDMIIRSQTAIIGNTYDEGCPTTVQVQIDTIQVMDQILQPGDSLLPSILTGAFVIVEFTPDNSQVVGFIMIPGISQVIISPQLSGANLPPVKKRDVQHDQHMWVLMQQTIANAILKGYTQLATILQNTSAYAMLSAQFQTK